MVVVPTSGNDARMSVNATNRIWVSRNTMKIPSPATSSARLARSWSAVGQGGQVAASGTLV